MVLQKFLPNSEYNQAVRMIMYLLPVEIIFIVDEIYLHPGSGNGSHLDDERSVHIVDDDIHARKSDYLMKLVLPFVDASVSGHE